MKKLIVCLVLACAGYMAVRGLTQRSIADIPFTPATNAAIQRAQSQGRTVLLNFSGSDWCGACMRMESEVFRTPEFADYVARRVSLLLIDFPRSTTLSAAEEEQNRALMERFDVTAFPTIVVLDAQGRELGRLGPMAGGPQAFIAELERIIGG